MDLDLGAHCALADCKLKDFLPFECDACRRKFCLEHRTYSAHACASAGSKDCVAIKCPVCTKTIPLLASQDVNAMWEIHSATDCDPSKRKTKKPRCGVSGCREILGPSNRAICEQCRKEVCIKHRYPDAHACPGRRGALAGAAKGRKPSGGGLEAWATGMFGGGAASSGSAHHGSRSSAPVRASSSARARGGGSSRGYPGRQQDPENSVAGTAARRRRSEEGGGSGEVRREVVDLTGLDDVQATAGAQSSNKGMQVDGGCPFCGLVEEDPVKLVEHVETAHGEEQGQAAGAGCLIG